MRCPSRRLCDPPSRLFLLLGTLAVCRPLAAQAPDTTRLADLVVTASRAPVPLRFVGSSVSRLSGEEARHRQITSLRESLQLFPGGPVVTSGGAGAVTSLFLRGVGSGQTLLLIDGVRMNDANVGAGAMLGGADLRGLGALEQVRGPQSTLYGGAAIGGVVSLAGASGLDTPDSRVELEVEGGSWSSWQGSASGAGRSGPLGIAASLSAQGTENERRPNDWHQRTQLVRVDYRPGGAIRAGATFRGWQQEYQSPGDLRTTNSTPAGTTVFRNHLATVWLEGSLHRAWDTRLLAGLAGQRLTDTSAFDGFVTVSALRHTRRVLDWQNTVRVGPANILTGLNREWSQANSGDQTLKERLWGFYGEARVLARPLVLTGGFRVDHYNTFEPATTYRITAAWPWDRLGLKLRGSLGTGFMPPSLAGRFGDGFLAPNPEIRPERSRGIDLGADRWFGERVEVGVTWFHNTLTDLIVFEGAAFPEKGRLVNLERARTSGVELSGRWREGPADLRVGYTLLMARSLSESDPMLARLIRRPRHTVSADLLVRAGPRTSFGAGVYGMANREDADFNQFPAARVNPGDFASVRLYGAQELAGGLTFRLRVDNALDRRSEPAYGFPVPGRTLIASLAMRFR